MMCTLRHRDRARSGWVIVWVLASLPAGVSAQGMPTLDITHGWSRWIASDDDDRSGQHVADQHWPVASLSDSWQEQGLVGETAFVWYRKRVTLPESLTRPSVRAGVLLGALTYGSYEVFADGVAVGRYGSDPDPVPYPRARVIELPREIVEDGEVLLALSVRRIGWAADAAGAGRPAFEGALVGPVQLLRSEVEVAELRRRQARLDELLFATVALAVGLFHIFLYGTRPSQRAYLWFGMASVAFAANALSFSPWTASFFRGLGTPFRLSSFSGHVVTGLLLLFLQDLFERRPGAVARGYILSQFVLAVVVLLIPFRWVVATEPARFLWLFPGLAMALLILVSEVGRGHPDARVLSMGGAAIALAEAGELMRLAGAPLPTYLPYAGFTLALFAVAVMLAGRFSRAHRALDDLRRTLEDRVAERTAGDRGRLTG